MNNSDMELVKLQVKLLHERLTEVMERLERIERKVDNLPPEEPFARQQRIIKEQYSQIQQRISKGGGS